MKHSVHAKFLSVLFVAMLVFGLGVATAPSFAADPVEISVLLNPGTLGNEYIAWLRDVWFPKLEAEKPHIKVNINVLAGNRLDLVATAVAGGVPYDIVDAAHTLPMIEGVGRGWHLALDDYIATWEDADQMIPSVWAHTQWEGKTYAIPHHLPPRLIAYNKQLFELAGLDADSPPTSWEQMLETTRRLTRTQGDNLVQRGYHMSIANGEMAMDFELFGKNNAIRMMSEDYRQPTFHGQSGVETVNFMKELYDINNPVGYSYNANAPVLGSFYAGETAMIRAAGAGVARAVATDYSDMIDLGTFLPQRSPEHDPVSTASINSFAILRFSPNPDEAWEVLEHMYARESMEQVALLRGQQIPRYDVLPFVAEHSPEVLPFYDAITYLVPRPKWPSGGGYTYTTGLGQLVRGAVIGEQAPEIALDEARRRIQIMLDAFWDGVEDQR